jgi:hypothetical protein
MALYPDQPERREPGEIRFFIRFGREPSAAGAHHVEKSVGYRVGSIKPLIPTVLV